MLASNFSFVAIFIYCPCKKRAKARILSELILYVDSINLPFVIICDFNEIASDMDKLGGAEFYINRMCILNKFFSQVSCAEIPFDGTRFT